MNISHKIELNPNTEQICYFKKACGVSRFAYNWALAESKNQKLSSFDLNKKFNSIKKEEFQWVSDVTKFATQVSIYQVKLPLSDRVFKCPCGLVIDRDYNASLNIKNQIGQNMPEFTPVEITALRKQVYPAIVTSIYETGREIQR